MTALRDALHLPDDDRVLRRGAPTALAAAAVWLVAATILVRIFALGGWNHAWVVVGAALAVPAMVIAYALLGPLKQRTAITAAVAVVAVVLIPIASAGATPSAARLVSIANGLHLPGRVVHEVRIGEGRCRDACPELRRTVYVDNIAFAKAYAETVGLLRAHSYEIKAYPYAAGAPARVDALKGKVLVSIEFRSVSLRRTRVALTFLVDGPTPAHSVG